MNAKRLGLVLTMVLTMCMGQLYAENTWFDEPRNFSSYSLGQGKVHCKVLIFASGFYNHWAIGGTYIYAVAGGVETRIVEYNGDNDKNTDNDYKGWVNLTVKDGTIKITNTYDQVPVVLAEGKSGNYYLSRTGQTDRPTYFEFDWYPSSKFNGLTFTVKDKIVETRRDGDRFYHDYTLGEYSADSPQSPLLFTPTFYSVGENGVAGLGHVLIPYVTYQEPISYYTSYDSTVVTSSERSGQLFVMTSDTMRYDYNAVFKVKRDGDQTQELRSNTITIPAFHRIYDFKASDLVKADGTINTKQTKLTWSIRTPSATDVMPNDMFLLQRAYKADFSDAESIDLIAMVFDTAHANYSYIDSTDAAMFNSTNREHPIYYRVSRISTSNWGYKGHDWVATDSIMKNPKLLSLNPDSCYVTKNSDFDQTRKITLTLVTNKEDNTTFWDEKAEVFVQREVVVDQSTQTSERRVSGALFKHQADGTYKAQVELMAELPCSYYTYKATLLDANSDLKCNTSETITLSGDKLYYNTSASLSSFNASKGYYPDHIFLQWNQTDGDVDVFQVYRRLANTEDEWSRVTELSAVNFYRDKTVEAGKTYEYRVICSYSCNGTTRRDTATAIGWLSAVGSISGHVRYANGTGNEGVNVVAVPQGTEPNVNRGYLQPINTDHDFVTLNSDDWSGSRTYQMLIRLTGDNNTTTKNIFSTVPQLLNPSNGSRYISLDMNLADSMLVFKYGEQTIQTKISIVPDTWIPFAVVYDAIKKTVTLYQDGKELHTQTNVTPLIAEGYKLHLLRNSEQIYLDEFRIWERALTGKEIDRTAHAYLSGKETNLAYYYTFDNTFQYVKDGVTCHYVSNMAYKGASDIQRNDLLINISEGQISTTDIPSSEMLTYRATTSANGEYCLGGVPFGNGATYDVTPTAEHGKFTYNNTSAGFAVITLDANRPEATDIDFVNTESVRFTGRVLYRLSTIPVHGAHFLINGVLATTATGSVIETNAAGNFDFDVPMAPITVQVVMEGHTFAHDGFFIINNDSLFQPSANMDGLRMYDETKVRLVGRVAGGNDQGQLPLGFGLSKNNLGDSISMSLELEGDNTALFVYDPQNKTIDQIDTVVTHSNDSNVHYHTNVVYQQKRILIYPDQTTGEFFVDLFPVKYKLTQLTATGYSTLTNTNTAIQVLDLTNRLTTDTLRNNGVEVLCNDTFRHVYHSDVSTSLTQLLYGMELGYLGVEKAYLTNFDSIAQTQNIVYLNEQGEYEYLFGRPVFTEGKYSFRVTAHEDYYYNGNKLGTHDQVMLKGNNIAIYNGMHSETEVIKGYLDDKGQLQVVLQADYPTYTGLSDNVMRKIQVSVEHNGEHISSEPIEVYVFADRLNGVESVNKTTSGIRLFDILRDPPGSGSYSSLASGSTYQKSNIWNISWDLGTNLTITHGKDYKGLIGAVSAPAGVGAFSGQEIQISSAKTVTIPILYSGNVQLTGTYEYTTTETIQTGSDAYHVGANADIYIGSSEILYHGIGHGMAVLDSVTYAAMRSQVKEGTMKLIASGRNSNGEMRYLTVGRKLLYSIGRGTEFAYTQEYILTTVIPTLLRERNSMLLTTDSATAQRQANTTKQRIYYTALDPTDEKFGVDKYYWVDPVNATVKTSTDEIATYNRIIREWFQLIYINEKQKVQAINENQPYKTYSISGAAPVSYAESVKYSDGYSLQKIGISAGGIFNVMGKLVGLAGVQNIVSILNYPAHGKDVDGNDVISIEANTPTAKFSVSFEPKVDVSFNNVGGTTTTASRSYSFTLAPDEFGYMDVNVYRIKDTINTFNKDAASNTIVPSTDYTYSSFMFYCSAGASRCPYEKGDSTICYSPGTPLSNPTIALENPHITIDKREISNVQADQKAIFKLSLTNDQPTDVGIGAAIEMPLELMVVPNSNPNGLKLYIDGSPMGTDPVKVFIPHGKTVVKTLEVERGQGYDFNDITLRLRSTCTTDSKHEASISVHFIPAATALNITTPHNKWVLNTQSAQDSAGYYIPVTIDGFDIHSDGFDHIELQYKQVNQSDNDWVNTCSYYLSDSLYALASGNKAMIKNSKIENVRFYGGRDPMEQNYELRAVSYARYGNGFVTRSSDVLQGIKDTRRPEVFGTPTPADGILGVKDMLSIRFSEAIAGNYLDEDANFEVLGGTNNLDITQTTSLHFSGETNCVAKTQVSRNMNDRPFTIEAMIKPAEQNKAMTIFSLGNTKQKLRFSLTADNRLRAEISDSAVESKVLSPLLDFTRCVMTYDTAGVVRFYAGTMDMTEANQPALPKYTGSGILLFGNTTDGKEPFHGNMLEARIWSKAEAQDELSLTYKKHLTGYERELMSYYPMNTGLGNTCRDLANGATLTLQGTSWTLPEDISLHITNGTGVQLDQDKLARSAIQDLTLMLWFKTDEHTADTAALFTTGGGFKDEDDAEGKVFIGLQNGSVVLRHQSNEYVAHGQYADQQWHHLVYTVNRTYNLANLFVDGNLSSTFAADKIGSMSSNNMWLGACHWTLTDSLGNKITQPLYPFSGYLDEFVLFEQALPNSSIQNFNNVNPSGEEMGLVAYLPFAAQQLSDNGRLELEYSPYNARVVRDKDGNVVNEKQKLLLSDASAMADKTDYSPTRDATPRTKYNFAWACNDEELMINLKMLNKEINKQNIFITVRNVEDLNGNRLLNPMSWTVYVDRNQLRWSENEKTITTYLNSSSSFDLTITNEGGTTRQYQLTSLPSWLTAVPSSGSLAPQGTQTIHFTIAEGLNIGDYTEYIYLQDDQDLFERLLLTVKVESVCPWQEDHKDLPMSMSLIGKVLLTNNKDTTYDTDSQDIIAAFINDRCVGMANITYDNTTLENHVYMTIYGNEKMKNEYVQLRLWQSGTGKIYILDASTTIRFEHKHCYGCPPATPVILTTSERKVQRLSLIEGWNWNSFYINPTYSHDISTMLSTRTNWTAGDIVKSVVGQTYSQYTESGWYGTLKSFNYKYIYMFYVQNAIAPEIEGNPLSEKESTLTFYKGWNVLPYLLDNNQTLTEAMSDYMIHATAGDILKSKDRFAVFSSASKWEGNLTYMEPGQGYLLYHQGDQCSFTFYDYQSSVTDETQKVPLKNQAPLFVNRASSNMSVIATLADWWGSTDNLVLAAYVGNELAGKIDVHTTDSMPLFFLTIGSELTGAVRFALEQDGEVVAQSAPMFNYNADAIIGSLDNPLPISFKGNNITALPSPFVDKVQIVVTTAEDQDVSLAIYSESGQLLTTVNGRTENGVYTYEWHSKAVPAGIYMAVVQLEHEMKTIRLIKQK